MEPAREWAQDENRWTMQKENNLRPHPNAAHQHEALQNEYFDLCRTRDELAASKELYKLVYDAAPVAYVTTNPDGIIENINRRALEMLGQRAHELIGTATLRIGSSGSRTAFAAHLRRVQLGEEDEIELRIADANGETRPVLLRSVPVFCGVDDEATVQTAITDISALKKAEERLRQTRDHLEELANHDPLTHLPNRMLLLDRLSQAVARCDRQHTISAIIFMDIDRFKVVNDSLGHDIGDSLLQIIANRLRDTVRINDTVARLGGDEFTVILENVVNTENAASIARKIIRHIAKPMRVSGHTLRCTPSMGICLFNGADSGASDILRRADMAMYAAKSAGGHTYHVFDPSKDHQGRLHQLERELYTALEQKQFHLRYQPQYDFDGETVIGHEALVRWQHPVHGLISPADFIPLAEKCGLIVELGKWILEEACSINVQLAEQSGAFRRIAVNVSPIQLARAEFVDTVDEVLQRTGHPPEQLEIEITETAMMTHTALTEQVLRQLRDMGVSVAIDDFGTGYSSLIMLKRFPINRLKVDASFVRGLDSNENDRTIASAIVSLAREMQLETVAEGVETREQFNFLRKIGCTMFQGFLFSEPVLLEPA